MKKPSKGIRAGMPDGYLSHVPEHALSAHAHVPTNAPRHSHHMTHHNLMNKKNGGMPPQGGQDGY